MLQTGTWLHGGKEWGLGVGGHITSSPSERQLPQVRTARVVITALLQKGAETTRIAHTNVE
jgi:hypothetical protein